MQRNTLTVRYRCDSNLREVKFPVAARRTVFVDATRDRISQNPLRRHEPELVFIWALVDERSQITTFHREQCSGTVKLDLVWGETFPDSTTRDYTHKVTGVQDHLRKTQGMSKSPPFLVSRQDAQFCPSP
jgi:hypothetical protein